MKIYNLIYFIMLGLTGALFFGLSSLFVSLMVTLNQGNTVPPELGIAALTGIFYCGLKWIKDKYLEKRPYDFFILLLIVLFCFWLLSGFHPFGLDMSNSPVLATIVSFLAFGIAMSGTNTVFKGVTITRMNQYYLEVLFIRLFKGLGYVFFFSLVFFPFYTLLITGFKSQSSIIQNPIDYSIDFSQSWGQLFQSYFELFTTFNFGVYIFNSLLVSVFTVLVSILFAVPGAYSVARLKFPGRKILSRSILLIYMVPAIVLVIPLYGIFSLMGLRDSLLGLLIVYPATTLPVSVYMLKGYFANIPAELEESGMIDGCGRLEVIMRITLPLCLPALASVGLYVFMIAWNEFLFAFMFLDNPETFTISRGVVSLNSSEVPRQYLMAGAVIVTLPVLLLFLWFERFLVQGLTAGSVKG